MNFTRKAEADWNGGIIDGKGKSKARQRRV